MTTGAQEVVHTWETTRELFRDLLNINRPTWARDWRGDVLDEEARATIERVFPVFLDSNGQQVNFPIRLQVTYRYRRAQAGR